MKVLGIIQAVVAFIGMVAIIIIFSMSGSMITAFGFYLDMGSSPVLIGIGLGLAYFLIALLAAAFTYALGELFYLLIALEENTRGTVIMLQSQNKQ